EESKVEVSGDLVVKENLDILAPSTSNSLEGILGTNDWHTSDVTLLLPATDDENGSGVAETKYSLDNASTWVTYIDPIALTQEGIFNVQYFSIDKAGNKEETKTAIIKIDKTAPEAKLIFNVATQKLEVIGRDNLSENVVATISEQVNIENDHANDRRNVFWFWGWLKKENKKKIIGTATLVDQAGHKTEVVWEKKSSKDHRIDLAISSIAYDGIKEDVTNSSLQYKWMQDWWKRKYLLFASHLSTEEVSLESHYFPSKNQTWLMEKPKEIADDDGNDNAEKRPVWKKMTGMIIPSIITDKGSIKINY
ncbi:MAG: hypothetical protein HGA36_04550, partial [Candidatus Moranbacteria bacterium]|nr:hypothetical protein [Candidatus Moranbacteria bacterium]